MREQIKETGVATGFIFYALIILLILSTIGGTWGLFFNRKALPFAEETRRLTFSRSMAYQQGSQNDFENLCLQYQQAKDDGTRSMIRDMIARRKADYVGPDLDGSVQSCFARLGI